MMSAHNRESLNHHIALAELASSQEDLELARTEANLAQAHGIAAIADDLEQLVRAFRATPPTPTPVADDAADDHVAYAPVSHLPMRPDSKDQKS